MGDAVNPDGGEGHERGAGKPAGGEQELTLPPGSSLRVGDALRERPTGEGEHSGGARAVSATISNPAINPTRDAGGSTSAARQRPDELVMEGVWLPWSQGRGLIEFAAGLADLSQEPFEAP